MTTAVWIIGAFIAGGVIGWFVTMRYNAARQHSAREIADELFRESEQQLLGLEIEDQELTRSGLQDGVINLPSDDSGDPAVHRDGRP